MQATGIRLGTASTSGTCINPGSDPLNLVFAYSGNADNGNLLSQTIARGSQSWTQSYPAASYDGANRLTGAAETGGSNEWSQSYGYDQWGIGQCRERL